MPDAKNGNTPCRNCRHFDFLSRVRLRCDAFPDGIPLAIYNGAVPHDAPIEGDHGVVFDPMRPDDLRDLRLKIAAAREAARTKSVVI